MVMHRFVFLVKRRTFPTWFQTRNAGHGGKRETQPVVWPTRSTNRSFVVQELHGAGRLDPAVPGRILQHHQHAEFRNSLGQLDFSDARTDNRNRTERDATAVPVRAETAVLILESR